MDTKPSAPQTQQVQFVTPRTSQYGFPDTGNAITGVINLFFFFLIATALIKFLIDIIVYSKKNFLANFSVSLLVGIISGFITGCIVFLTLAFGVTVSAFINFAMLACVIWILFLPLIAMNVLGKWYKKDDTTRFLYGSIVYLGHGVIFFLAYRVLLSFVATNAVFGPATYFY